MKINIISSIVIIIYLFILSFLYVYISRINPLVIFDIFLWLGFGFMLIFPVALFAGKKNTNRIIASIVVSAIALYLVYAMKSSIFYTTVEKAIEEGESSWFPTVKFGSIFDTLFSWSNFNEKLDFLTEYDTLSLSRNFSKSKDTGTGFTNFCRLVECLGIFLIPLYLLSSTDSDNMKKEEIVEAEEIQELESNVI
jgi:hypothetical protein